MYCRNCGAEIEDSAKFCSSCGTRTGATAESQPAQQPVINVINNNTNVNGFGYVHKSKWVAFFLCLFLGFLGAHRFYVGKIGTGIIWLFTFGFFGIGWALDLIFILFGGFRDKAGQRLV